MINIKKTNIETKTYKVSFHFYIDVVINRDIKFVSLYLYYEDDIKRRIKDISLYDYTEENLTQLISDNDLYQYYKDYIKPHWAFDEDAKETIKADFDITKFEK